MSLAPCLGRALALAEHLPDKGDGVRRMLEEMKQGEGGGVRSRARAEARRKRRKR